MSKGGSGMRLVICFGFVESWWYEWRADVKSRKKLW